MGNEYFISTLPHGANHLKRDEISIRSDSHLVRYPSLVPQTCCILASMCEPNSLPDSARAEGAPH